MGYSPWSHKELDTIERLNSNKKMPLCNGPSANFTGLHRISENCILDHRKHHIWKQKEMGKVSL